MLKFSGFKRTLCGGVWELFKDTNGLTSTGRLGCCPIGLYMTQPEESPFVADDHCSPCDPGLFTDDLSNDGGVDDTSCKYCPKGYEIKDGDTKQCHICSFSKVSCK